jgi:hypothetical protein
MMNRDEIVKYLIEKNLYTESDKSLLDELDFNIYLATEAKEEEIERLLYEGVLTVDSKGRLKKSDKTDPEDYELSNDRD